MKKIVLAITIIIGLLVNISNVQAMDNIGIQVVNIEYVEYMPNKEKTKILTLKDDSSIVYNESIGLYTFYPSCIGDNFIQLENKEELKNCVLTYLELSQEVNQKENIKVVDRYYKDNAGLFTILSNGSYILENGLNNEYIFQPSELGDWDIQFNNIEDLKKCINDYVDIKGV